MKNPTHKLALFVATLFVSALPFTADAEDVDEKAKPLSTNNLSCQDDSQIPSKP